MSVMTKYAPAGASTPKPSSRRPLAQTIAARAVLGDEAGGRRRRRRRRPWASACWNGVAVQKVTNWCAQRIAALSAGGAHVCPDLPAGEAEGLARGGDQHGALTHPGERRERHVRAPHTRGARTLPSVMAMRSKRWQRLARYARARCALKTFPVGLCGCSGELRGVLGVMTASSSSGRYAEVRARAA